MQNLLGRAAAPGEIAGVIAFLASDDARYITGAIQELYERAPHVRFDDSAEAVARRRRAEDAAAHEAALRQEARNKELRK